MSHWASIIKERGESGLTIKEFCRSMGINEASYYYWLKRLRKEACDKIPPVPCNGLMVTNTAPDVIPNGWAICETAAPINDERPVVIEIGACRLSVGTGFDPELFKQVCRLLVAL
jgi:hypothetical protein